MHHANEVVFLSLGSNLGDRRSNLAHGIASLDSAGIKPIRISSYFETEPVGFADQPWFLNLALEAETMLPPLDVLRSCQEIELSRGRARPFPQAPRTLDLDILLYGDVVLDSPSLTIPHPRMLERRFVLAPLAEIAPARLHPVLKQPLLSLLQSCTDTSQVHLYSVGDFI
jgi:2-amino-4-hydroxy-6-hydroxymethyldihydropteridine diphosphokinase